MRALVISLGGLCMFAASSSQAASQMPWESTPPPRIVEDRFRVEVGFWNTAIDTTIRSDASPQQPGTTLSGENDLGLRDSRAMPDFELTVLPGKRHQLRINGMNSRRDGVAVLNVPIQFDGNTYNAGRLVRSTLNLNMVGVGYGYRALKTERYELDGTLSVQITNVKATADVPADAQHGGDSYTVPLPFIGAEGRWEVLRKWWLTGRYQWLGATVGDVKGSIHDWRVGVQWQFNPHLGVGLQYRDFDINVDSRSNSHPGRVDLKFRGPQLQVTASM